MGNDRVVPITVKLVGFQVDGRHLFCRELQVLGILVGVQYTTDLEPRLRPGPRNEADDGRVIELRLASPVLRNE